MIVIAAGAVLGGADRLCGNRLGYGDKFEEAFRLLGPMALSMAGMICLAPVLAGVLGRVIVPFYRGLGVDPAMFGGVLAIDMGGYQLAKELAADGRMGSYAGIVVSALFGCTLVFTIPVGMGMIPKEDRRFFARGIMLGVSAMPAGLFAGGILSGLSISECLHQNLPVFAAVLLLVPGLWKMPDKMVRGFCMLADGIQVLITAGLVLAAVEYLTGWNPLPGMAPIEEAMEVVASIGVVMLGSLPAAEFLQRILRKPFLLLGKRLGMNPAGMTGLLVGMVSVIPAIAMYKDMDEKGKVVNGAFLVSAASMLAAHAGFTLSREPELLGAMLGAKLGGGAAAFILAMLVFCADKRKQ